MDTLYHRHRRHGMSRALARSLARSRDLLLFLRILCFGAALVNWQKSIEQPPLSQVSRRSLARTLASSLPPSLFRCLALSFSFWPGCGRRRRGGFCDIHRLRQRRKATRRWRRQRLRKGCEGLFSLERDRKKAAATATTTAERRTASVFICVVAQCAAPRAPAWPK